MMLTEIELLKILPFVKGYLTNHAVYKSAKDKRHLFFSKWQILSKKNLLTSSVAVNFINSTSC